MTTIIQIMLIIKLSSSLNFVHYLQLAYLQIYIYIYIYLLFLVMKTSGIKFLALF